MALKLSQDHHAFEEAEPFVLILCLYHFYFIKSTAIVGLSLPQTTLLMASLAIGLCCFQLML